MPWKGVLQLLVLQGSLAVLVAGKSVPRVIDKDFSRHDTVEENDHDFRTVPFNLEETYDQSFRANGFNGTWRTDTDILYTDNYAGDVRTFDVTSGISRTFMDSSIVSSYDKPLMTFSHDNSYILISYDFTAGFRYSMHQKFDVYSVEHKTYTKIADGRRIPLAKWSPNKNALAYVLDNDIYYQEFTDSSGHARRLTHTGVPDVVYNGVPDWVYEEEVLASAVALWFSPDGNHLAFATYNDTRVKDMSILYYGKPGILVDQYPTEVKIKYPKAGSPNPIVTLSVVDLANLTSKLVNLQPPADIVGVDNVLYTVNWWGKDHVVATWTNRVQNMAQLVRYDTSGKADDILYQEEHRGWLRVQPPVYHNQYAVVLKLQNSGTNAGRFLHATRYEYKGGRLIREKDLTPGATEVISIVTVDHVRQLLYYLGTGVGQPSQRNLYLVPLDGTEPPECVSCNVLSPEGNSCTYASAYFSSDCSYYVLACAGPDPTTVSIFDAERRLLYSWENNRSLRRRLLARTQPRVMNLDVRANGYDSKVRLYLPPDFDERNSYPLLINVYAGPNTVRITESNTHGFESYMATNRSVIYGHIDGRGSAYKGSKMLFEIYRRMGTVEIEDQIAVTRYLQETYPWIDANRTAIWGWSYGGFSTAMVLATDMDSVFKCGISVAPVSSWIYYGDYATDRFMGLPTPSDNLYGYNHTDVTRRVEGIRGKKYMLIHGTGDDNVHYQQAMVLNKALVQRDIMFEQQTYTDEAHGLTGVSPHLYHTMDRFWGDCLGYTSRVSRITTDSGDSVGIARSAILA
ncbi:PREDICTED: venom dipeptidyl peptidase 4 [Dufourea novaeangliae]|uniref:venom dipeptidyl peptidase 4 n=1 Tax=Dufourea novaeangliae TaxID=178035 RepID=UPI00076745E2|nr:PREDICTED: venom dipeptidyl peptidase 4 [Dufourea novaeangliae]